MWTWPKLFSLSPHFPEGKVPYGEAGWGVLEHCSILDTPLAGVPAGRFLWEPHPARWTRQDDGHPPSPRSARHSPRVIGDVDSPSVLLCADGSALAGFQTHTGYAWAPFIFSIRASVLDEGWIRDAQHVLDFLSGLPPILRDTQNIPPPGRAILRSFLAHGPNPDPDILKSTGATLGVLRTWANEINPDTSLSHFSLIARGPNPDGSYSPARVESHVMWRDDAIPKKALDVALCACRWSIGGRPFPLITRHGLTGPKTAVLATSQENANVPAHQRLRLEASGWRKRFEKALLS